MRLKSLAIKKQNDSLEVDLFPMITIWTWKDCFKLPEQVMLIADY